MVMVKQYLAGTKLYGRPSLPYGPVYFFYNWAVRMVTGTPETHDVVRMSELLPWLLTAFVAAWIVFRITSSLALASVAHLAVFLLLWGCFYYEVGHPQELCILLLVSLVGAGVVASTPRWRFFGVILLGVLPAALLLVKINIGVFAILATSLAVSAHSLKTKLSQLAFFASAAASLLLPVVLMKAHLGDWPTRMFALLVTVSMMAALLVLVRAPRSRSFTSLDCVAALGAFVSFCAVVTVILKLQGVLLSDALHVLLLDILGPLVFRSVWYYPLQFTVGHKWYLWMAAGLFLAGYFSWNFSGRHRQDGLAALKVLVFLSAMVDLFYTLAGWNFLYVLPPALFKFYKLHSGVLYRLGLVPDFFFLVPPFCWLLLYWNSDEDGSSRNFARTLLCVLAIVQMLYAYPIAGAQVNFAEVLPAIVLIICLSDFLVGQGKHLNRGSAILVRGLSAVVLVCVAVFYLAFARIERNGYNSLPSLQLPGADRIHLPEAQAEDYRWLVSQLDSHCDVFVGFPEEPSLHVWTGKDPLSGVDMSNWMMVAPDDQQLAASTLLSQHPNACAVYNQELVDFWDHPRRDLSSLPLVRYLSQNFKVAGTAGPFALLVHNDRNLSVESIH